jgi:hypothetical protein
METWSEVLKSKKFWAAVIASLVFKEIFTRLSVLTAAGGLKLWSRVLYIVTLGSAEVRDAPYASAALNPYAVPSLMLLFFALFAFIALSLGLVSRAYGRLIFRYLRSRGGVGKPRRPQTPTAKHFIMLTVMSIYTIAFSLAMVVPVGIENQAVASRRFYEADRDIVAPYMTQPEIVQLQADFSEVETKAQYIAIIDRLVAVADQHHVKIYRVTW